MLWGYALVWAGQYMKRDPDPLMAKLKFLKDMGLSSTHISLKELDEMGDAKRNQVAQFVHDNDLHLMPGLYPKWVDADADAVKRRVDEQIAKLEKYIPLVRPPNMLHTGAGGTHRFDRETPLQVQLDRMAKTMPEAAKWAASKGLPLGIENHGDLYVSDLVEVIKRVPGLGLFLDTGNTYLIGEAPLPAFHVGAPYTIGTHFKDHRVRPRPDTSPLSFEIGPSTIGEGDVPLKECFQILKAKCPNFAKLNMMIELIPPSFKGNDPVESVEKSVAFVKSLS
jgi:sugar phosphate isomerase/epimerase